MKTLSGLKKRKSLKLPLIGSPRRGQKGVKDVKTVTKGN
jgi:hypothetical protein